MTLAITTLDRALPLPIQVSAVTAPFWDALAQGRFIASSCSDCHYLAFPPKAHCPGCAGNNMGWQELSGKGVLYSRTTVHSAPPMFGDKPLEVAIVDLEEGVRLVTKLIDCEKATLDSTVILQVTQMDDGYLFAAGPL
jgi:uncharacterized OB-fold protein